MGIENRGIPRVIGRTLWAAGIRLPHTCSPWTVYAFVARVHTQENQGTSGLNWGNKSIMFEASVFCNYAHSLHGS